MNSLSIRCLKGSSDARGESFYLPKEVFDYLGSINEMHYVTIKPGAVRGNHYHRDRREVMFLYYADQWEFAWRRVDNPLVDKQIFAGSGGVIIKIDPCVVHAVKNTGNQLLRVICCSNRQLSSDQTEREIILE